MQATKIIKAAIEKHSKWAERTRSFDDVYGVCINAITSVLLGLLSVCSSTGLFTSNRLYTFPALRKAVIKLRRFVLRQPRILGKPNGGMTHAALLAYPLSKRLCKFGISRVLVQQYLSDLTEECLPTAVAPAQQAVNMWIRLVANAPPADSIANLHSMLYTQCENNKFIPLSTLLTSYTPMEILCMSYQCVCSALELTHFPSNNDECYAALSELFGLHEASLPPQNQLFSSITPGPRVLFFFLLHAALGACLLPSAKRNICPPGFEPYQGFELDMKMLIEWMEPKNEITQAEFMLPTTYITPHLNPTIPYHHQPTAFILVQQLYRGDPDTRTRIKKKSTGC